MPGIGLLTHRSLTLVGAVAVLAGSAPAQDSIDSPFSATGLSAGGAIMHLAVDADLFEAVRARDTLRLEGFVLPDGQRIDLVLERAKVFSDDAVLLVSDGGDSIELDRPDPGVYRGSVAGAAGSVVFLSLTPDLIGGLIDLDDHLYLLSTGPMGTLEPVLYDLRTLPEGAIPLADFVCHYDELARNQELFGKVQPDEPTIERPGICRVTEIAFETDRELLANLFGNNQNAATAYIQLLAGAMTEIYRRDVNLRFEISYLNLWTGSDPWNAGNTGDQLNQFRNYWQSNNQGVERDVAHMLSGRGLGGGVAWLDAVCGQFAYGLSANLAGSFPYPLQDNHPQNWDVFVVAHELGHNYGTLHTHDGYLPPIDSCASGDCSVTPNGTIMSYCHTCPGGMTNIQLRFHDRVIDRISDRLRDYSCVEQLITAPTIVTEPLDIDACLGDTVTFTIEATGEITGYVWLRQMDATPLSTGPTLVLSAVTASDIDLYFCIVESECGSTTSTPAALAVTGEDCNANGICDANDIANGTSPDTNTNGIPDECETLCDADLTGSTDPNDPSYGIPDGALDANDFFYYLDQFAAGNLGVADLTGSNDPNNPAFGVPDGILDASDFFFYLTLFAQGC